LPLPFLCREADNVKHGKPTLCPWQEVKDKQIGVEGQVEGQQKAHGSQEAAAAAAAALRGEAGSDSYPVEVEFASPARHAHPHAPPLKDALASQPAT
jgi:hypothetical protein